MKIIEINKEQFINFLLNHKPFSQGHFGKLTLTNGRIYKIYYRDFIQTYLTKDDKQLDFEVRCLLKAEEWSNFGLKNPKKRLKVLKRLLETKSCNLITGVLSYKGLFVGVEMTYFEDYIMLEEAANIATNEEIDGYLKKCYDLIEDLLLHDIVPKDIKENNVMINKTTGNVILIDLDGDETVYGPKNYVNNYPYNREIVENNFHRMVNRLTKQKELSKIKL